MDTRKIVWDGLVDNTTELLTLQSDGNIEARGLIVGTAGNKPVGLSYKLKMDEQWNVNRIEILSDGELPMTCIFNKVDNDWFDQDGKKRNDFADVTDVDITLTPFTNSLPINRIRLQNSESKEIKVIYIDIEERSVTTASQRYTNLGNNNFRFEHLDTGFMAIIEIDENGLVVEYPGLFKRVFPARA